jgi:hypothetical protein
VLAGHSQILQMLFAAPLAAWILLSDAARELCRFGGWMEIVHSPVWAELHPAGVVANASLREEQQLHLEMIPLRDSLFTWAAEFGLVHNGTPATWVMDLVVETLHQAGRRPPDKRIFAWSRTIEFSQAYPARIEEGWTNASSGLPEQELFTIRIEIPPKQPDETIKAFEKRFNKICRKEREGYLRELKKDHWTTFQRPECLAWIDRLAKWQAGNSTSAIAPSIPYATFCRGIKHVAAYIEIDQRKSRHNPRLGRSKF